MRIDNSTLVRCVIAAASGACAYGVTLYRFLSYSQRNALPQMNYLVMAGLAFALAFLLVLGLGLSWWRVAGSLLLGVLSGHGAVIAIDLSADPTDHNLLPFEFVIISAVTSPAFFGAWLGQLLTRWARNGA